MINVIWGGLLWFLATLLFYFFGDLFLIPGNEFSVLITFVLAIPLIALATYPYYYLRKVPQLKRLQTAVQIAIPGMILDIFSIIYFQKVFPQLHIDALPFFSAWLLWAYSLIILTGFPLNKVKSKL